MQRIAIDAYVFDVLMPDLVGHDRRASAFILYLHLWARTEGASRAVHASYAMLADATGLSKRATQDALALLARRQLVVRTRSAPTAAHKLTVRAPWRARRM